MLWKLKSNSRQITIWIIVKCLKYCLIIVIGIKDWNWIIIGVK